MTMKLGFNKRNTWVYGSLRQRCRYIAAVITSEIQRKRSNVLLTYCGGEWTT